MTPQPQGWEEEVAKSILAEKLAMYEEMAMVQYAEKFNINITTLKAIAEKHGITPNE